jgi:hypothetical protein
MSTFKCMFCLYSTLKKTDYNKHITTNKHLKNVDEYNRKNNNNENSIQINQTSIQLNQDLIGSLNSIKELVPKHLQT